MFSSDKINGVGKLFNPEKILIYRGEFKENYFDGNFKYLILNLGKGTLHNFNIT